MKAAMVQKPRLILAGGTGYIGKLLTTYFLKQGWDVAVITRQPALRPNDKTKGPKYVHWDGETIGDWTKELEGSDALINLTGKSVNCRYTKRNQDSLVRSRIQPTRLLGQAVQECVHPPAIWMNASTATLYRHTFDHPWTENGEIGAHPEAKDAFSVELATAWENAFLETDTTGVRKVLLRSAMVLGRQDDANNVFRVLRRLTRIGLGGTMGTGNQFVSWVHETDFCRAVEWIIRHPKIGGPVNVAAPTPLTNREMMQSFRSALGVPIGLPAPRWLLEIGAFFLRTETELILKSRRVISSVLRENGFTFNYTRMPAAIEDLKAPN